MFVSFIFIALFPSWHLALVLFSSLFFNSFCSGRYNFWFPLFTRSIYCTSFFLDCVDFAYGCIGICVYSVTLSTVVINLCLYVGLLQFCGVFIFSPLFSFFFFFFITLMFNFLTYYIFSTLIPLFAFPTVLFPLQLNFNEYKSVCLPLFNFAYLFFLSFSFSSLLSTYLLILFHCFIPFLAP